MTMDDAVEELFGAVVTAMDSEGRIYSYDFRLLPSKQVRVLSILCVYYQMPQYLMAMNILLKEKKISANSSPSFQVTIPFSSVC